MPNFRFHCLHPDCLVGLASKSEAEVFLHQSENTEANFPDCPLGHGRMAKNYAGVAGTRCNTGITHQSKGVFPREFADMETESVGDKGPVYCSDYQDYRRKLKERGLREREPSRSTAHAVHQRWL